MKQVLPTLHRNAYGSALSDVTLNITVTDFEEAQATTSLTFTPANWDTRNR